MTATANLLSGLFKIDARNKKLFLAGNIVPNSWYHKLLTKTGSPDLTTIAVLAEVVYWYRPKVVKDKMTGEKQAISKFLGNVWQTSYSHFKTKFNLSHETVRRSLVRLEELGIIVREFRTVCVKGQAYNNRLFIKLNEDCKSSFFMPSEEDPCPQIGGEHIENNKTKNLNNRSTEQSKFFKNSDLEQQKEVVDETMATKEVFLADSNFSDSKAREQIEDDANLEGQSHRKKFIPLITKKPLSHFYPLSEEDCKALRFESSREFSRNFINQLLLSLSLKYPNYLFGWKKAVLNYMTKALKAEMRDAIKTGHETFRLTSNVDQKIRKIEQYLAEVEEARSTDANSQVRRKIAASLRSDDAYLLLTSIREMGVTNDGTCANSFVFKLSRQVEISTHQRGVLLDQVQGVFGRGVAAIEFEVVSNKSNETFRVDSITREQGGYRLSRPGERLEGLWGRVRSGVIEYYNRSGKEGECIDRHWFSKLNPEVNEEHRQISLKAPTGFIRDWVKTNYLRVIEEFCQQESYELTGLVVG
jgi:DNA-binding Lrp family transcriptional regulator